MERTAGSIRALHPTFTDALVFGAFCIFNAISMVNVFDITSKLFFLNIFLIIVNDFVRFYPKF